MLAGQSYLFSYVSMRSTDAVSAGGELLATTVVPLNDQGAAAELGRFSNPTL